MRHTAPEVYGCKSIVPDSWRWPILIVSQHQVVPKGVRRFALTGRAINPEYYDGVKGQRTLRELFDLTPEEAKEAGKLPQGAAQFSYPGPSTTTAGNHGE